MGRGRKPISSFQGSDWETVFYNSVGTYVQFINIELSKEYKLEPLSSYLKIIGGYAFKTPQYKKQGIPIIRISDFNNEQIVLKDVIYYNESKDLEKYELKEGDIIIALTGGTIAKLAIVQPDLGKIYLNQRVGKFEVLHPELFEKEYIYWIARSVQSIIKNLAWGAAIPNVSPKQIEQLKFPFPPKKTQKGIIAFLNDLKNNTIKEDEVYFNEFIENEIITLQEKQILTSSVSTELTHQLDLVKQLRQAFLREAMQGKLVPQDPNDEPASVLLEKIKAEKEKLIKEGKLKKQKPLPPITEEEIPFDVPENWVWCRLGELANHITDGEHQTPPRIKEGRMLLSAKNVRDGHFDFDNVEFISEEHFQKSMNRCKPELNDILIVSVGATIGRSTVLKEEKEFALVRSVALIKPQEKSMSGFIKYVLDSPLLQNDINTRSWGTAQPCLYLNQIKELSFPLPPLSEQQRIVRHLDALMRYCDELEASIKESQQQNELLLQQVLREALEPAT